MQHDAVGGFADFGFIVLYGPGYCDLHNGLDHRGQRDGLGDPSDLFGPGDAEFYVLAAKVDDTTVNSEKN